VRFAAKPEQAFFGYQKAGQKTLSARQNSAEFLKR